MERLRACRDGDAKKCQESGACVDVIYRNRVVLSVHYVSELAGKIDSYRCEAGSSGGLTWCIGAHNPGGKIARVLLYGVIAVGVGDVGE